MGLMDRLPFKNRPGAEEQQLTPESLAAVETHSGSQKLREYLQKYGNYLDWVLDNHETFYFSQTSKKIEISKKEDDSILIKLDQEEGNPVCVKFFKNEENVWQAGTYYLDSKGFVPQDNEKVEISKYLLPLRSLMEALEIVVVRKELKETLAPTEETK